MNGQGYVGCMRVTIRVGSKLATAVLWGGYASPACGSRILSGPSAGKRSVRVGDSPRRAARGPSVEALSGLAAGRVETPLLSVDGPATGGPEEPGVEPFGLGSLPRARQPRAKHVDELVGAAAEGPEQVIAVEVVDGALAHRKLRELLDALLGHTAGVVVLPDRQRLDRRGYWSERGPCRSPRGCPVRRCPRPRPGDGVPRGRGAAPRAVPSSSESRCPPRRFPWRASSNARSAARRAHRAGASSRNWTSSAGSRRTSVSF